jgi:hypothetical protein
LAQRDGLFAARGLDNDVSCFSKTTGNIDTKEEFILDNQDDGSSVDSVCGRYWHPRTFMAKRKSLAQSLAFVL